LFATSYSLDQWLLFFFFYCFCGWVWESCYVSVLQKRWVNRGFLHGPLLPIYGSGAIIILLSTLNVQNSLPLIFLFGMISSTALEYFTGAAMEGLFHVRYWDYTGQRCNLKGYICLSSTVAWGFCSLLLVKFLHPPVAALLTAIPGAVAEPLAFALTCGATADAVVSFRAACDLREMLEKLTEENEDLRRLAMRAEVVSAFAGEDLKRFRDRTRVEKLLLSERLEADMEKRREARAEHVLEEELHRRSSAKLRALAGISEALERYRAGLAETRELTGEALAARRAEMDEALEKLRMHEGRIRTRTARSCREPLRILRGNPSATASKYAEALENLRRVGGLRHD
jgi:uncharacterized membrane protein